MLCPVPSSRCFKHVQFEEKYPIEKPSIKNETVFTKIECPKVPPPKEQTCSNDWPEIAKVLVGLGLAGFAATIGISVTCACCNKS